jgi:lipopolysaccharide heptosyltransferase II
MSIAALSKGNNMKKILVFGVNWFGDALMSTPFFEALKSAYPQAKVILASHERVRDIFEDNPYVDMFMFSRKRFSLLRLLSMLPVLLRERISCAYLLRPSFSQALVCRLAGIKTIVAHTAENGTPVPLTVSVAWDAKAHRMDQYLRLLESQGIAVDSRAMRVFMKEDDIDAAEEAAARYRAQGKRLVILHPMANWHLKRWPEEYFSRLAHRLGSELNATVVFTGSRHDTTLVKRIRDAVTGEHHDLTGAFGIRQMAAFLKSADLFISGDTGIMHLAAAVGTPLIGIFGPTDCALTGPRGDGYIKIIEASVPAHCRRPCYHAGCSDSVCMRSVSPDIVFDAVKEYFDHAK